MKVTVKVQSVELLNDNAGKILLSGKSDATIYDHQFYLKVAADEAKNFQLGAAYTVEIKLAE